MKTKILNITISAILLFFGTACSSDQLLDMTQDNDSASFYVDFNLQVPHSNDISSRGNLQDLSNLKLLVFDENNQFLYSRLAILNRIQDTTDESFHPTTGDNPTKVLTYSVQLLTSEKLRTIHFISNHDWSNFQQDYFLQGLDAGQIVGGLVTDKLVYWQSKTYSQLNKENFMAQTIKLIRNQAQIVLENKDPNFELTGYTAYNHYDRGTVAPFIWDETAQKGYFPNQPDQPTIPAGAKTIQDFEFSRSPISVFEQENDYRAPICILFKGRFKGKEESFYKLDLKQVQSKLGKHTSLYTVLRNRSYLITLKKIGVNGYKTAKEALSQPSGNNIYSSLEMEKYNKVSDGTAVLEVSQLSNALVAQDQEFETTVYFSEGVSELQFIPSWDKDDPYLGELGINILSNNRASLKTKMKKVPTDRYLNYTIDVVAKNHTIMRKINILARYPYIFESSFSKINNEGSFSLTLEIPKNFNKDLLPIDIQLRVWNATPMQKLEMSTKDMDIFYHYPITKESQLNQPIQIEFRRNSTLHSVDMTIYSDYFQQKYLLISRPSS